MTITFTTASGEAFDLPVVDTTGQLVNSGNTITIANLGPGESRKFVSTGESAGRVGFAIVTSSAPIAASAIFSMFSGTPTQPVLISEAAVPSSTALTTQSIFVDENAGFRTAFAYANPSNVEATVNFSLVDTTGTTVLTGVSALPAQGQVALFVDELFSDSEATAGFVGSLRIESDQGVAAVALRFFGSNFSNMLTFTTGSSFVVNTTDDVDDGICNAAHCSLREAILGANAKEGLDSIEFNLSGQGPHVIRSSTALPTITDNANLDATTEPDYAGQPVVEIDGSLVGVTASLAVSAQTGGESSIADGIRLAADGNSVRGLRLNRFLGAGLRALGRNNTISNNLFGSDGTTHINLGNAMGGFISDGSAEQTVQGNTFGSNGDASLVIDGRSGNTALNASGNTFFGASGSGMTASFTSSGTATFDGNTFEGTMDTGADFTLGGPIELDINYRNNTHFQNGQAINVNDSGTIRVGGAFSENLIQESTGAASVNLTVDGSLDTTYDFVNDQILDGSSAGIRLTAQGSLGDRVTLSATGAAVARNGANGVDVVGTGSGDLRVNLTNIQLVSNESNNVLLDFDAQASGTFTSDGSNYTTAGLAGVFVNLRGLLGERVPFSLSLGATNTFDGNRDGVRALCPDAGSATFTLRFSEQVQNFNNNTNVGILIDGCAPTSITGDAFLNNGIGVQVLNGGNATIANNTITGSMGNGIEVTGASSATIQGNTISGSGGIGVSADAAAAVVQTDNTFSGNVGGDVDLAADSASPFVPGYSGTVNGVQYETTQNDHTCCIASTDFPNTITLNVTAPVAGDDANIVSFGGTGSWVAVSGTLQSDGSFQVEGRGTVAGFPNTLVTFTGTLTTTGLTGTYTLGAAGGLPSGGITVFTVTGTPGSM